MCLLGQIVRKESMRQRRTGKEKREFALMLDVSGGKEDQCVCCARYRAVAITRDHDLSEIA
jgi:hypothetical protein